MPVVIESKTPHFGLRDFLFYFVPGGVVFLSILLFAGVQPEQIDRFDGVVVSLASMFVSYLLGQIVYPATYRLRRLVPPDRGSSKAPDEFSGAHLSLIENHTAFYTAVVFRDRSFARFANAMVLPTFLLSVAVATRLWHSARGWAVAAVLLGCAFAVGFVLRYQHYEERYRNAIRRYEADHVSLARFE